MDFLKVLVVIAFLIVTILTVKFPPDMHQPLRIEDADFKLTRISDTLSTKNIPVNSTTKKVQSTSPENSYKNLITQAPPIQAQTQSIQFEETKIPQTEKIVKKNQTETDTNSQLDLLQQIINQAEKEEETQQNFQPHKNQERVEQSTTKQQSSNFKNPYMTEQEEIIAWNKWRSNIQNQIMKDSQIDYAPLGTIFLFNFVVDKYGNISNVKVQCSNPNYMDVVRNNVKPAITNLQRKPILQFPKGTQRTSTVVRGLFIIGTQDRYSTPNDYADFERITY